MTASLVLMLIGLAGGFAGGLLGLGGGLLFVPLLIFLAGLSTHVAIGTSLAAIVATSLAGSLRHALDGKIHWQAAVLVGLFAIAGAWIGASLSLRLNDVLLRRVFAVLLVFMAVRMFFRN